MTTPIHDLVRDHYAGIALNIASDPSCSGNGACCGTPNYSAEELASLPDAAALASLGCGNPLAVADLHAGERVLDLGSGGGIDVLLSAKRVGPTGRAFGLDMTDEMLALARRNAAEARADERRVPQGPHRGHPAPGGLDRRRHQQLRHQPRRRQAGGLRRDRARPAAGRPARRLRHRRGRRALRRRSARSRARMPAASPARSRSASTRRDSATRGSRTSRSPRPTRRPPGWSRRSSGRRQARRCGCRAARCADGGLERDLLLGRRAIRATGGPKGGLDKGADELVELAVGLPECGQLAVV